MSQFPNPAKLTRIHALACRVLKLVPVTGADWLLACDSGGLFRSLGWLQRRLEQLAPLLWDGNGHTSAERIALIRATNAPSKTLGAANALCWHDAVAMAADNLILLVRDLSIAGLRDLWSKTAPHAYKDRGEEVVRWFTEFLRRSGFQWIPGLDVPKDFVQTIERILRSDVESYRIFCDWQETRVGLGREYVLAHSDACGAGEADRPVSSASVAGVSADPKRSQIRVGNDIFQVNLPWVSIIGALIDADGQHVTGPQMQQLPGCHGKKISKVIREMEKVIVGLKGRLLHEGRNGYRLLRAENRPS